MDYCSVSDAARELGVPPKCLSDLLYQRVVPDETCPIVAGRRLIPRSLLPTLRQKLVEKQVLPASPTQEAPAC